MHLITYLINALTHTGHGFGHLHDKQHTLSIHPLSQPLSNRSLQPRATYEPAITKSPKLTSVQLVVLPERSPLPSPPPPHLSQDSSVWKSTNFCRWKCNLPYEYTLSHILSHTLSTHPLNPYSCRTNPSQPIRNSDSVVINMFIVTIIVTIVFTWL